MKKWMYLIAPAVMLGIFMVFYFSYVEKAHAKEAAAKAKIVAEQNAAAEKKKVAENKAREDAKKRQEDREAEERKKEKERADKQAAEDKKVKDATDEALAKLKASETESKKLQADLDALRANKEKLTRETFDIAKQVELARIARRNAEIEGQRFTEMISKRAADSSMTRLPVVPPAPAAPAK